MWLTNLRLPGKIGSWSVRLYDGIIQAIRPSAPEAYESILSFSDDLIFPGLINSHDHLDFNLFPALGNASYTNYRAWGKDIHRQNSEEIKAVQTIPQDLRTSWGIYKNIFNGFTTVVNHGQYLDTTAAPITIFQQCHNLHSIGFERHWRWKLNRPMAAHWPFVLHVGEGTDVTANHEITQLIRWNLFRRPLIGIHGVAMNEWQAARFRALVWCPASNYFLLDSTAPVHRLKTAVPVLFGTDSTLTAPWDSWSHIRLARQEDATTDEELMEMLTTAPAAAWELPDRGRLAEGLRADLVIARPKTGTKGWDAFYELTPDDILLVLSQGRLVLFDACLKEQLSAAGWDTSAFLPAGENGKYVEGDVNTLMSAIRNYYPGVRFPVLPVSHTRG